MAKTTTTTASSSSSKKSDKKYRNIITSPGTAVGYVHLSKPDTKGKFADNKYKVRVKFDDKETTRLVKELKAFAAEVFPNRKNVDMPFSENDDGDIIFTFKSLRRPMVEDAKKKPIGTAVGIAAGSVIRVAGSASNYTGKSVGINIYLDQVRVLELVEYSGGNRSGESAFGDEEDGFEFDGESSSDDEADDADDNEDDTDGMDL